MRKSKGSKLDAYVHLLGVETDAAVGRRADVTREAVRVYRTRLGIPAARDGGPAAKQPLPVEPTLVVASEEEELPPEPGERSAEVELPPASPDGGRKRSAEERLAPYRDQLGQMDDAKIAEMAGLSRGVVGGYRRGLGIPAYDGYLWTTGRRPKGEAGVVGDRVGAAAAPTAPPAEKITEPNVATPATEKNLKGKRPTEDAAAAPASHPPKAAGQRRTPSKLDGVRELIGVLSDREVAERVGLSTSAVTMYRKTDGIAAATKSKVSPTPITEVRPAPAVEAPAPRATVSPTARPANVFSTMTAWKLTVRVDGAEVERYAVTRDASSAAGLGQAAGEVVRMERIGEGLA